MQQVKMHLTASESPRAQSALADLIRRYGQVAVDDAEVIVALGGDGFMLSALHSVLRRGHRTRGQLPVYGLNVGTVGFLVNAATSTADLPAHVSDATAVPLVPLRAAATYDDGTTWQAHAINEVTIRRSSPQASSLRVTVDGTVRLEALAGDGILLATAAGSAAYNYSAGGPVLPLTGRALALTGICTLRPRRWPGAVLAEHMSVTVDVLEPAKRPIEVSADMHTAQRPTSVHVAADPGAAITALFDPGRDLDERLLAVQFA